MWACRTDVEIPQLGQVFTGPVLTRVIPFQPGTETTVPGVVPPVCKAHLLSTPSEVFQGEGEANLKGSERLEGAGAQAVG